MTVETELVDALTDAGLIVYAGKMPERPTLPSVVYQRISTPQVRTHERVELEYPRFQISCWANDPGTSIETAATVKAALDLNRSRFKMAYQDGELDLMDEEAGLFRRVLEFVIWIDKE